MSGLGDHEGSKKSKKKQSIKPGKNAASGPGPGDGPHGVAPSSCCGLQDLKRLQTKRRLYSSRSHTVLIDVQRFNSGAGIYPHQAPKRLDVDYVEMPNSPDGFVDTAGEKMRKREQLWDVIFQHVHNLTYMREATVNDIQEAILTYNQRQRHLWTFKSLSSFVQKKQRSSKQLFPKIAALAMTLPDKLKAGVPLLRRGSSDSITLSQMQVATLLANAFFCTFPDRTSNQDLPSINFNCLFGDGPEGKMEKLQAIMHYFSVVTNPETRPAGLLTFERRCLVNHQRPKWRSCTHRMPRLHVSSAGTIETEGAGLLQVDFASCWVGGGVLDSGLLQEEILFLLSPELIVSRLFTEQLDDNECLIITGGEQYSSHEGCGDSFKWAGPHQDQVLRDDWCRRQRKIVAIDAQNYKHVRDQFTRANITRELNKAFCAFRCFGHDEPDIATGKWGCGSSNGDSQLKALIQMMAAAVANRSLAFFTYGDKPLQQQLQEVHHLLVSQRVTVGDLMEMLENYCVTSPKSSPPLFDFIKTTSRARQSPP